ncbi:hypothetical protein BD310DRAFT_910766 [Dichomitus squalens]|uniref:FAD/NAD(P)-binding domain-containing protein n=1 Tax=Dichomitus squalens TaxID=114155 RepID=A0A4Q9PDZ0_9APHY|nr:hypothetical protein BD310DRAFT_910766 [Dichomitus squalens]
MDDPTAHLVPPHHRANAIIEVNTVETGIYVLSQVNAERDPLVADTRSITSSMIDDGSLHVPAQQGPETAQPIKVIVIGAGFSGILAGIRFPQKIPNVDLVIYEKSAGVGGTWYNNRYPITLNVCCTGRGIACDIPAHCYQFSFEDKATAKIQRERLKSMEAKPKAVKDFDRSLTWDPSQTVFSANCRSWYKLGKAEGRVVGLWPGSNVHAMRALQHPRWEDYEYEYADSEDNSLYWLGDGQTWAEKNQQGDRAWYLREELIDRPPGKTRRALCLSSCLSFKVHNTVPQDV